MRNTPKRFSLFQSLNQEVYAHHYYITNLARCILRFHSYSCVFVGSGLLGLLTRVDDRVGYERYERRPHLLDGQRIGSRMCHLEGVL